MVIPPIVCTTLIDRMILEFGIFFIATEDYGDTTDGSGKTMWMDDRGSCSGDSLYFYRTARSEISNGLPR